MRFTGRSRSRSITPPHWRRAVEERLRLNQDKKNRMDEDILLKKHFNEEEGKRKEEDGRRKEEDVEKNVLVASVVSANFNGKTNEKERRRREEDEKGGEERVKKSRRSRSLSAGEARRADFNSRHEKRPYNEIKFKYNENEDDNKKRVKTTRYTHTFDL